MACWKLDESISFKTDDRYPDFVTVKIGNLDRLASVKDMEKLHNTCEEILSVLKGKKNE